MDWAALRFYSMPSIPWSFQADSHKNMNGGPKLLKHQWSNMGQPMTASNIFKCRLFGCTSTSARQRYFFCWKVLLGRRSTSQKSSKMYSGENAFRDFFFFFFLNLAIELNFSCTFVQFLNCLTGFEPVTSTSRPCHRFHSRPESFKYHWY